MRPNRHARRPHEGRRLELSDERSFSRERHYQAALPELLYRTPGGADSHLIVGGQVTLGRRCEPVLREFDLVIRGDPGEV